jgi:hypothetical protein
MRVDVNNFYLQTNIFLERQRVIIFRRVRNQTSSRSSQVMQRARARRKIHAATKILLDPELCCARLGEVTWIDASG